MLRDLSVKSVYDSSKDDLARDLFVPLLKNAVEYRRGVGFFTSGWLREAAAGLIPFAERGGRAFFITSPHLEPKDWQALQLADQARQDAAAYELLHRSVRALESTLSGDTAVALAWLVADGVLTFKFAIPKNRVGDYHDKLGIVTDAAGDQIVFHGSLNDSAHGLLNGESFSIFRSWESGQLEYVLEHAERFDRLWNDQNDFFWVYDMTEAVREDIARLRRDRSRPYSLPQRAMTQPLIRIPPDVELYPFQREGVANWLAAKRGMFELATGTGKTFVALAAAAALHRQLGSLAVVVSAPFNHLVDQWVGEATRFGFVPITCRESSREWVPLVRSRIQDFNIGGRRSLCLVTTHKTGSERTFTDLTSRLRGHVLYIGDEVHYLGSPQLRKGLLHTYSYRIGLSATPERWFDEEGTAHLRGYFGATVAEMPLEKAIGQFLTPYRYHPHPVYLTPGEMDEFNDLSLKINQLLVTAARRRKRQDKQENGLLEHYLRQRAGLIAKAENKLPVLRRLLEQRIQAEGRESIQHTIVYCAPGQTGAVVRLLADLGLRAHEFIYSVDNAQRIRILDQFDAGDLQALVAIKCLDEGVNIPATREVYFVSSTSNPREFVQRRGRVLRKHPGKVRAVLHDLVVVPPERFSTDAEKDVDRVLLRKEMPRVAEFCSAAENEFEARDVLFPLLLRLGMVHLLDLRPWDIYHQTKQWGDYGDTDGA